MNEILKNKKLYIFDMDGTVYLEDSVFPFAVDFINKLRNSGRRILFFTNNASKNISERRSCPPPTFARNF